MTKVTSVRSQFNQDSVHLDKYLLYNNSINILGEAESNKGNDNDADRHIFHIYYTYSYFILL